MENLVKKLRQRAISVTPQRLAVLAVLESRRDHPSAEQIFQEVKRQLPAISFNTIYKTLETLCQKGLVTKVNPLHEVARYDGQIHNHAHLICRQCHVIVDLEWTTDEFSLPPVALPPGFRAESQNLTIWGLCPQCQGKDFPEED
ncbi:MAG: transcriptional repressor [Thermodesulfobacteriota bacterium]